MSSGNPSTLADISPFAAQKELVHVVVETPKRSRNKYKYDPELGVFLLHKVLPAGASFPYDFGYVPGTLAEDGDPADVLVLMDESAFCGCVVPSRLIGVIEAEQTEAGQTIRNDRLVCVADCARNYAHLKSIKDMEKHLVDEIEHFFISYNQAEGREFRILKVRGPNRAREVLQACVEKAGS